MSEKTDQEIFSQWKRELRTVNVEGFGTVHFYEPPSCAEMEAYLRSLRFEGGDRSFSIGAVVDGIIARVKKADSQPRWYAHHRDGLMQLPPDKVLQLWNALGGEAAFRGDLAEAAEKK